MCGIIGVAGAVDWKSEKMFKDLLILDILRGKHSTGVASMYGAKGARQFRVAKDSLNAVDFMDTKAFTNVMAPKSRILLGHNRAATRGAITTQNAHPFEFEHIMGVHNGTLTSYYNMHNSKDYQVDSQALYSELNENGVISMWGKLNGAAALAWIDKRNNTLNFLRNKERKLYYAFANKGKTVVWASEEWMIYVAAGRNGVALDDNQHFELPINEHFTFNVGEIDTDVVTMERNRVAPYVAPLWTSQSDVHTLKAEHENEVKKHLTKEGIKVGEEVEFEVDLIKDFLQASNQKANVLGVSLKGTPVRLWSMDVDKYQEIIDDMAGINGGVFSGIVKFSTESGLILGHESVAFTGYTVGDLLEAQAKEDERKKNNIRDTRKMSPITVSYKVSCQDCRKMVKTYFLLDGLRVCSICNAKHPTTH